MLSKLKKISLKTIGHFIGMFWKKSWKFILILFFLGLVGFGAYFWRQTVYRSGWSDEEKKQYLLKNYPERNLNMDTFQKVIDLIEKRKHTFESDVRPEKDIFKAY
jgi:hypothetical protein